MLDLNIDITKNKNPPKTEEVEFIDDEDSGTSDSSIIDNQGETNSAFIFDIMKIGDDPVTQQLFPERIDLDLKNRVSWLKLSHSGDAELKIVQQKQQQIRKSRRGPRSRSSQYRGVTFYRRTGRWESHIWDCGKQVYLGGFDTALSAARAYDRAAIKFRGVDADINFSLSDYEDDMNQMRNLSKEEFVHVLRRQSTGFARNNSKYRGCGRWEPRIGNFHGKKEAVTGIGPTTYEGGIIFSPNNNDAGEGHNLELSLGISMPAKESKRNNNNNNDVVRSSNSSFIDCELPKMVENKHVNSLFHLPTLPGMIPGLLHAKQFLQGSVVAASSGFGSSSASSTNFPFSNQNCHYYLHRS